MLLYRQDTIAGVLEKRAQTSSCLPRTLLPLRDVGMLPLHPSLSIWGNRSDSSPRRETVRKPKSLVEVSCLWWALSRYASALRKSAVFLPSLRYYAGSHNGSKLSTVSWESDRVRLKTSRSEERECATRNFIPTNGGAQENRDGCRKLLDCRKIWMYVSLLYFLFVQNATVTLFHSFSRINRYFGWKADISRELFF